MKMPPYPAFVEGIRRAPDRGYTLNPAQTATALKNALRYIPNELHEQLAPEFLEELRTRGRIYGYRFRPEGDLKARPIDEYRGQCIEGKAFQVMIDNNLAFDVALYPYELVTYGETGSRGTDAGPDPGRGERTPAGPVPLAPRRTARHHHQRPDGGTV